MNTQIKMIAVALVCAALSCFADVPANASSRVGPTVEAAARAKKAKLSPEEVARRRENIMRKTGGFVIDRRGAKGLYGVVNFQKKVGDKALKSVVEHIERDCMLPTALKSGEAVPKFGEAAAQLARYGVNAATFVVDDPELPPLIGIPESRVAYVNVAALAKGADGDINVEKRVMKEILRSVGAVFGCGYTLFNAGPMRPITKVEDLDSILLQNLPVEATSSIQRQAEHFGFKVMRRAFYKVALEEGWAPEPVNDYQKGVKAVFEKQRSEVPTAPIVIKPEAKK